MEGSDDECYKSADIIIDLMRAHAERHASGYYYQQGNLSPGQTNYSMKKIIDMINQTEKGPAFITSVFRRCALYLHPNQNVLRLKEANDDTNKLIDAKTHLFENCADTDGSLKQYILTNLNAIPGEIALKNATRDESSQNVAQELLPPVSEKKWGDAFDQSDVYQSKKHKSETQFAMPKTLDIKSDKYYEDQSLRITQLLINNMTYAKNSQNTIGDFIQKYETQLTNNQLTNNHPSIVFEIASNLFRAEHPGLMIGQKSSSLLKNDNEFLTEPIIRDNYEIVGVYEGLKEISVGQVKHINERFDKSRRERDFLIVSDVPKNPQSTSKRKPYGSSVTSAALGRLSCLNPRVGGSKTKRNRTQKRNKPKTKRNRNKSKQKRSRKARR